MRQILIINEVLSGYTWCGHPYRSKHYPLENLFEYVTDPQREDIECEALENNPEMVKIWYTDDLKRALVPWQYDPKLSNNLSHDAYIQLCYSSYSKRAFEELPSVIITKQNLDELYQQWKDILKIQPRPQYLFLRQEDNGFVHFIAKNELSEEDWKQVRRDVKIDKNYSMRLRNYRLQHREKFVNKVWLSESDNFFDSDCPLYDPVDEIGVDDE